MRKFFQDYSANGVVLIFCTLALGLMFRLTGLQEASAWGDEIASLFYANNLSQIFLHESHTPLYYLICKCWMFIFGESIIALRYLFVFLSFTFLALTSVILLRHKQTGMFLFFIVLWWLWPTDVIFSRQARHYGLYAELSFFYLIFWRYRESFSTPLQLLVGTLIQFLHPFTLVLVWFLATFDFIKKRLPKIELILSLLTSLPVIIYYGLRFITQGQVKVMSNISWINDGIGEYLKSMLLIFGGDSYPLNQYFPLTIWATVLFVLLISGVALFKMRSGETLFKFLLLLLITIAITELASRFYSNIRVARYSLYLVPFFLYGLLDAIDETKHLLNMRKAGFLLIILVGYNLFIFRPWSVFPWDDQNVAQVKGMLKVLPGRDLVVCGNRYQLDYYFKKPNLTCSQVAIPLLREKKPFYFFDINGSERLLGAYILQEAEIRSLTKIRHATFLTVEPR